jgi:photosystem II S4 domain protein
MLPKDDLLKGVEHRDCLARLLDQAEQALKTWEVVYSDFLSPPEQAEAQRLFQRLTDIQIAAWGGYPQAEQVAGNFMFDPASHRDFLGAVLGAGLVRDKIGDILVGGERGAQVIVVPEVAEFLSLHLTQVRSVPVKTQVIPWSELRVRPPQQKQLTTVEASLRLDAIASAGFGMSRSKMADLISAGDVRVNWKTITQPSHTLKTGDLVAIRGKGRLTVGEVAVTKKERYRVDLSRSS